MKRSAETRIGEIVLDLVNIDESRAFIPLTGMPITNDSDISQSLNLIMLLELECDLLKKSIGLSILSPNVGRNGYTNDEKAEVVWRGKIERLLQSYL